MNLRSSKRPMLLTALGMGAAIVLSLAGCRYRTVEDAVRELRGPKYARLMETQNHRLEFRYVPKDLRLLTCYGLKGSRVIDRKLLDSLKSIEGMAKGMVIHLTIGPKNDTLPPSDMSNDVIYGTISGFQDYRDALQEYQFGLQEKVWIESGGRRFDMATYHMSNTWGMTKSRTFTLLFEIPDSLLERENVTLVAESVVPGFGRKKFAWTHPDGVL